jgi:hypothetical protein
MTLKYTHRIPEHADLVTMEATSADLNTASGTQNSLNVSGKSPWCRRNKSNNDIGLRCG